MADLTAEAVTAQLIGARARQEDAVLSHFPPNEDLGLAVLSDGMGGHDDGDLASRILASEMFGELFLSAARKGLVQSNATTIFGAALGSANRKLRGHIDAGHISDDTGGTLVSVMVAEDELRWISVGDSPLYLLRGNALRRLNEDHSMAPQIDMMVANGEIGADEALTHADRNCLTSAVTGRAIPRIDCPEDALPLEAGDIVIVASDGLDTLSRAEICELLHLFRHKDSATMAQALLQAVADKDAPEQDNTSLVIIRMADKLPAASSVVYRLGQGIGGFLSEQRARLDGLGRPVSGLGARSTRQ